MSVRSLIDISSGVTSRLSWAVFFNTSLGAPVSLALPLVVLTGE
jgi:hypothetical protein